MGRGIPPAWVAFDRGTRAGAARALPGRSRRPEHPADKGYTGAGIGILTPIKGSNLPPDNRTRNTMINAPRAPPERGNALLKRTWKAVERSADDPGAITAIAAAALVLLQLQRPAR